MTFFGRSGTGEVWDLKILITSEVKMNSTFWIIWTVTNPMNGLKRRLVNWIVPHKRKVFNGEFAWRSQTCNYWQIWAWLSQQIIRIKHFLKFLTVGIMMQRSQKMFSQLNHLLQMSNIRLGLWLNTSSWWLLREECSYIDGKLINRAFHKVFTIMILKRGTKLILLYWNSLPRLETIQ